MKDKILEKKQINYQENQLWCVVGKAIGGSNWPRKWSDYRGIPNYILKRPHIRIGTRGCRFKEWQTVDY